MVGGNLSLGGQQGGFPHNTAYNQHAAPTQLLTHQYPTTIAEDTMPLNPIDDTAAMDDELSAKQRKKKKQENQKKLIMIFLRATTKQTDEARNVVSCQEQKRPPLDKAKLFGIFSRNFRTTPEISKSVFWRYTKQVYTNKAVHKDRKTGGYKGFSGLCFRNPTDPHDLNLMRDHLTRITAFLGTTKEQVIADVIAAAQSHAMKQEQGARRTYGSGVRQKRQHSAMESYDEMEEPEYKRQRVDDYEGISAARAHQLRQLLTPTALEGLKLLNDPNIVAALRSYKEELDPSGNLLIPETNNVPQQEPMRDLGPQMAQTLLDMQQGQINNTTQAPLIPEVVDSSSKQQT